MIGVLKKMVKFSWDKVALSPAECGILISLLKETYPLHQGMLVKRLKITVGGISKAINKLMNKGLIFLVKDSVHLYGINPLRKREIETFLIGYDLGKNKELVLSGHAFTFEAKLNDIPKRLAKRLEKDPSFIGFSPKGWKCAFKKVLLDGSFKIQKTKNSCKLYAYFKTFGFNAATIEQINFEKFLKLKDELETNIMGLKIGDQKCIAKCPWQEYAIQKDPIAIGGIKLGIKHKNIEQSYGYPEWEEKGSDGRQRIEKIIKLREKEASLA
jgi:hypothetical protein